MGYRHVGGGWYELDDGTKIQGKDAAVAASAAAGGGNKDNAAADHEHRYLRGTHNGVQAYVCYSKLEIGFEGCGHSIPRWR